MADDQDKEKAKGEKPEDSDEGNLDGLKSALAKERDARRKAEQEAKANAEAAKKYGELEEAKKSETQKAADALAEERKLREAAEHRVLRLEVAIDKGLSPVLAKRLVGTTREELESDAAELATLGGTSSGQGGSDESDKTKQTQGAGSSSLRTRPQERTTSSGVPGDQKPAETNPAKLAELIPRRN